MRKEGRTHLRRTRPAGAGRRLAGPQPCSSPADSSSPPSGTSSTCIRMSGPNCLVSGFQGRLSLSSSIIISRMASSTIGTRTKGRKRTSQLTVVKETVVKQGDAQARAARTSSSRSDTGEQARINAACRARSCTRARARLSLSAQREEAQCSADKEDCLVHEHCFFLIL